MRGGNKGAEWNDTKKKSDLAEREARGGETTPLPARKGGKNAG